MLASLSLREARASLKAKLDHFLALRASKIALRDDIVALRAFFNHKGYLFSLEGS